MEEGEMDSAEEEEQKQNGQESRGTTPEKIVGRDKDPLAKQDKPRGEPVDYNALDYESADSEADDSHVVSSLLILTRNLKITFFTKESVITWYAIS